ncbi:unnamed protein product [Candida parapsilosis]
MMMLPKLSLIVYLYISVVSGLNIATNTIDRGAISLNVGDITINSGAYWSIINNAISAFVSNLEVAPEAGLYISSTSSLISLQVTLLGLLNSITNNGIISFNSLASLTSSNYNLIGWSFQNNGEMYLGASGIVASTMSITAASWKNTGLLVFYQNQRNEGIVNSGAPLGTINNNGQICFHNEVYHQTTSIAGTGCITADRDSSIYITNAALSVSTGQTFYLADGASSMIVQALSTPQTFNVRNFGQVNGIANKIGLSIPLFALIGSAWSYNSATGILTLRGAGLLSQYLNIGTGYDSSKFQVVTDSGAGLPSTLWGSIQYNGPVPNPGLPSQCRVCKSLPDIPGAQPTEYTTTITTTSNGNTLTETGIVDITTNTAGSWYTTTSIFTTGSTFRTEYTTSWTTTKPDGTIQTDSGIVSVSDTSSTTITTFPQPTQTEYTTTGLQPRMTDSLRSTQVLFAKRRLIDYDYNIPTTTQTEYTTTWTTTKDDGSVETDSGIVSQSGDSLTTITTFHNQLNEYTTTWTTTKDDGSVETTQYTTTWTTTKDDGSVETDSGIVSQSGDSLTTVTTFPQESVAACDHRWRLIDDDYHVPQPTQTEYTTTWTTTKDDGSVETDSGIVSQSGDSLTTITTIVSQSGDSLTTITTFPQPTQTEYTTTWTTTKDDGSVETDSGIVSQSGDSLTTITTFPQPTQTEYTTTWTTTKDDGSVETDSGIVSQSGDSLTTITTFHNNSTEYTTTWTTTRMTDSLRSTQYRIAKRRLIDDDYTFHNNSTSIVSQSGDSLTTITTFPQPTQTEYTTTWTTTKDDGSVETDSGIVSQSGDSLTTVTTFPQESVAGPVTTEYTTTWTTTKDDGSVETDSGIVSQSGDSLTTITTFPQESVASPVTTEYTTTWTTTKDDGSVETDSGIVSQSGDSLTTITTFPQESVASPVTTEYTTTWTTTKDDGSVETDSGIVSQSGDSLTTITTFPQPTQTEYTTTWTTTKDDGSVETDSGIVSQSGDSLTTITTFPQESVAGPVTTEYTTTWTTTKDDGSVETDSGIVSQSGDSLTTITTFPQESVASPVTTEYTTTWTTTKDDGSVETDWNVGSSPITTYVPTNTSSSISELIPGSSIVLEDSAGTISISEVDAPGQPDTGFAVGSSMVSYSTSLVAISDVARTSTLVSLEPSVSLGSPAVETTEVSNYSSETSESFSTRESAHTSNVSLSQAGSDEQYKSHTSRPSTLAEHTSGVQSTATIPAIYEGTGAITKYSTFVGVLASLIFVMV